MERFALKQVNAVFSKALNKLQISLSTNGWRVKFVAEFIARKSLLTRKFTVLQRVINFRNFRKNIFPDICSKKLIKSAFYTRVLNMSVSVNIVRCDVWVVHWTRVGSIFRPSISRITFILFFLRSLLATQAVLINISITLILPRARNRSHAKRVWWRSVCQTMSRNCSDTNPK